MTETPPIVDLRPPVVDLQSPIWKQLEGYSRYEISDTGLVKNLKTGKFILGSISQGYVCVTLYPDEGKQKAQRLHRVVAKLFCPNDNNVVIVNHLDGNPLNNNASNLEWTTARKNTQHAAALGKLSGGKTNSKSVRRICLQTGEIKEYTSITNAQEDTETITHSAIVNVCSGRHQTVGGYKWEYINPEIPIDINSVDGKEILGYTNYLITSEGKIYNKRSKRFLHPSTNQAGYLIIDLHGDEYDDTKDHTIYSRKRFSKRKKFRVHRLVAEYFIPNPTPELCVEVNHKNRIRTDNRVENLEWVTGAQNLQHAHNKAIEQYTLDKVFVKSYTSLTEAGKETGINVKIISAGLRRGFTAGKFRWKYKVIDP